MTSLERSERDRSLAAAVPEAQDPAPAPLGPAGVAPTRRVRRRTWLAAIMGAIVLPVAVAAGLSIAATTDIFVPNPADARVVSASEFEQQYGIKVNLVAVSAAGGMIDMRFTVTDRQKAEYLLHDETTEPALYVESNGAVIRAPTGMRHKVTILDGGSYFILYANPGGAIQAGTPVSVVINDVRIAPIKAQS
jgi:hypothetical protein